MADTDRNAKILPEDEVDPKIRDQAMEGLREVIRGSNEVLMTATTVFPFSLFPDTVTIDRAKVTVIHRTFFGVGENVSIRIEDVLNVTANHGPLLGSLHIVSRVLSPDKPYEINFLWRKDALKLKRILQGYIIALQKDIDVRPLRKEELSNMLYELGADTHK
jgi:hypothetical protein